MLRSLFRIPRALNFQARVIAPVFQSPYTGRVFRFSTAQQAPENPQLHEEVETKIFEVLKSAAKCKQDKLARGASFEELGFDSLDGVELVIAFEENLNVDLQDEDAEKIQTVDDAVKIFYRYALEKTKARSTEQK